MRDKKKKIIIGASIAIILLILVILIISISNNKKQQAKKEEIEKIELSELIDIEDINNLQYETEKTEEEISTKYIVGKEKYEIKAKVEAGETEGKFICVRGNYDKINMYKTEYNLSKYGDKTMQINNIMQEFEMTCEGYMEITEKEYEETETLYGESNAEFELPIEESIYNEGRLYSKTYKNEEKEYNINFYRKDNKIICEFVKIL